MPRSHRHLAATLAVTALLCTLTLQAQQTPDTTTAPASPQGGTIRGTIRANTTPLPGVAVTATNTLTGKKFTTTTDIDGLYVMAIPRNGRYVVRAELAGFALATNEAVLNGDEATAAAQGIQIVAKPTDFTLELASRAAAAQTAAQTAAANPAAALARGLQGLSLSANSLDASDASASPTNTGASLPSLASLNDTPSANTDAIAVSGQQGQTNGLAGISEDEIRQRVQDAVAQGRASGMIPQGGDPTNAIVGMLGGMMGGGGGGGFGGGGGGGGRGGGGSGAFRNFNPAQPHGSIFYQGANAALNSSTWSAAVGPGVPHFVPNPSAYSNRYGVTFASTPYIPGLTKPNTKQFVFLNLTGQKNLNAFLSNGIVPTNAERSGDFSNALQQTTITPANPTGLIPVTLYNPATNLPFANNKLPTIAPQAANLLAFYPQCNINCTSNNPTVYNYQTISNAGSNSVAINSRYVRTLGGTTATPFGNFGGGGSGGGRRNGGGGNSNAPPSLRQNINLSYNYSHAASDNRNIFLPLGGTSITDGNALNAGYTIGYGRLSNNASLSWNRNNATSHNYFSDTSNNPSATAGLSIPNNTGGFSDTRFYNGLPSLNFSGFTSLSNATPSTTVNQTISFSDFISYRHKKHNARFGFDIRRVHADSIGGNNPLGSFTFTGYATESPTDKTAQQPSTGSSFADFLLGLPQTTSIQAGLYKTYLRENVYDAYANDDFRLSAGLTLNFGLRYEYFGPYTEKNNRLVNLTHDAAFTAASIHAIQPGAPGFPTSLINPDRTMFSPRFGFAYKPTFLPKRLAKDTVIRGGYGINFNTGQYAVFARSLSHQAPFAATQTNTLASGCTTVTPTNPNATLTLAHGFNCSTGLTLQNNYAVDPNYRLGMVQLYNLNIQHTLPLQTVLNIGYNGSFGRNLDVVGSPNGTPAGNLTPTIAPFDYEESAASSRSNQLVISFQKRQQKGIALGATYTYSHSIDNASGVGGAVGSPVQNLFNLAAEEGNSSFDQRHNLSGNFVLELPFGPNRHFFNKGGWVSHALDNFNLSGNFTFASGTYFTPSYSSSQTEAATGNVYQQRPNRVAGQPIHGAGQLRSFFNPLAFTAPAAGQYGTASPGSIEGPGTVSTNASLSRTVPLGNTRSFEARVSASNVFNTVQYAGINTTQNSYNFGQVTSAASMRTLQVQARYRF